MLKAYLSGCTALVRGPICELAPKAGSATARLYLFVETDAHVKLSLRSDRSLPRFREQILRGGRRLEIDIDPAATELTLEASLGRRHATWRHALRPVALAPWLEEASRSSASCPDQKRVMRTLLSRLDTSITIEERARALAKIGRFLAFCEGEWDKAKERLTDAIQLDGDAGLVAEKVYNLWTLAYILYRHQLRFSEARKLLEANSASFDEFPEGRVIRLYISALLADETGDLRTAVREYREVILWSERLSMAEMGMHSLLLEARQRLALCYRTLGRDAEAMQQFNAVRARMPENASPYDRAILALNLGWDCILHRERGGQLWGCIAEPRSQLETALRLCESACPDELPNIRFNLALTAWQEGRYEAARQELSHMRKLKNHDLYLDRWIVDLEGRIALMQGNAQQALALFDRMRELSTDVDGTYWQGALLLGRARALEALGRPKEAMKACQDAEQALYRQHLRIGISDGRGSFLSTHEHEIGYCIDLLFKQRTRKDWQDAFTMMRRARVRWMQVLSQLTELGRLDDARKRAWEGLIGEYRRHREGDAELHRKMMRASAATQAYLKREWEERADKGARILDDAFSLLVPSGSPGSELSRPRSGELFFGCHPTSRAKWVCFAQDTHGVDAAQVDPVVPQHDPKSLFMQLLAPFREKLMRARHLVVLAYGPLRDINFHALPWIDDAQPPPGDAEPQEVLISRMSVAYGLDLPHSPASSAAAEEGDGLLIINPRGDLLHAREEGQSIEAALHAHQRALTVLEGDEEIGAVPVWRRVFSRLFPVHAKQPATKERFLHHLGRARQLHYIGTADLAGPDGWDGYLVMADDMLVTSGDVLSSLRVPSWVVLNACKTGGTLGTPGVESLSLAHAFLIAGSRTVIAAFDTVDDRAAAYLGRALYQHGMAAEFPDAPEALRRAQLRLRETMPRANWKAWRAYVR